MLSHSFLLVATTLAVAAAAPATTANNDITTSTSGSAPSTSVPTYDIPAKYFCDNFPVAESQAAMDVLTGFEGAMQQRESGQTCVGAGPAACKVLVVNAGAELSYCNDNHYPKCVDNSDLLYRTLALRNDCAPYGGKSWSGQVLFGDNTNLLLKGVQEHIPTRMGMPVPKQEQ